VLTTGRVVVEPVLLERLQLAVGDALQIGRAVLTIADVVLREPDRPLNFFGIGQRVFVAAADLEALDLLRPGSRARYKRLIKVRDERELDAVATALRAASPTGEESVETFLSAESRTKRFFDNFLLFLGLVGLLTLVLSGVGVQAALGALIREQRQTIAVMRTLGATARQLNTQYLLLVMVLGGLGTVAGVAAGSLLQFLLPLFLEGVLPAGMEQRFSVQAALAGLFFGLGVTLLFTLQPLRRLRGIKPIALFRRETGAAAADPAQLLIAVALAAFLATAALLWIEDATIGLAMTGGIVAFVLLTAGIARLLLALLRRLHPRGPVAKQALRGLFRPGNASLAILVTLTAALSVIVCIALLERNLEAAFVRSYPPGVPNLYFVDIQKQQRDRFARLVGREVDFYPIVRANLLAINDRPIDRRSERRRRGDNLGRSFSLTYRDHLLADEAIAAGGALFDNQTPGPQVSVLDTLADMADIDMGDRIAFRIQGVPLAATVTSIRTRKRETLSPFFYFVFPEAVLQKAPQSLFAALRVERHRIGPLQNRIAEALPNVSVINISAAIDRISGVLARLAAVIRFLAFFSAAAGLLILVSAVMATRWARTREAVYFKILGARSRFILQVLALENGCLGLASALLALVFAQTAAWALCTRWFSITYQGFAGLSAAVAVAATLLVTAVGLFSSGPVLLQKPITFLQADTET
jgi:putative ABC transport system permease protein